MPATVGGDRQPQQQQGSQKPGGQQQPGSEQSASQSPPPPQQQQQQRQPQPSEREQQRERKRELQVLEERQMPERIMKQVYGDWAEAAVEGGSFPQPLPVGEAAEGPRGHDRRYLWTDAWGVLNFCTLAHRARERGDEPGFDLAVAAARRLVAAVHACLGSPVGLATMHPLDATAPPSFSGTRFIGLRIGKARAAARSDAGMALDGMYWHYHDKWAFALARLAQVARDADVAQQAVAMVRLVHPYFVARGYDGTPRGLHWKLNTDASPIPGLGRPRPSSDALSGLMVYMAVHSVAARLLGKPAADAMASELADMRVLAAAYWVAAQPGHRLVADGLGYGLQWWEAQWLPMAPDEGSAPYDRLRASLVASTPMCLDVDDGMLLPFRLYGALMGARLATGSDGSAAEASRVG